MFEGTFTALVTPFLNDQLDEPSFLRLIEGQISAGITGVVPVGTTGESSNSQSKPSPSAAK
jgi:4-hydroxy-tetrahydrodipicolinate synthase